MESSEIETSSNIECGMNSSLYTVPNMPTTEQQESSFIVCDSRSSSGLPSAPAPLYSFDEDGDILPRVNNTLTPNNSVESDLENVSLTHLDNEGRGLVSGGGGLVNHKKERAKDKGRPKNRASERGSTSISRSATEEEEAAPEVPASSPSPALSTTSSRRRKLGMIKGGGSGGASEGSTESGDPPLPPPPQPSSEDKTNASSSTPGGEMVPPLCPPQVNIVLENASVPKIDFHAPSIEVVDDYLESNLDGDNDSQLKDLCSSLLGESGFPGHQIRSSTGSCVSLLSATPQQDTGPKRQKVPFDAVVFTERKPSTGDALIQSLGLSADGSNTIQDIASKNQGAARERLQLAEGGQVEVAALTSHCESCGVSPEDCLKKLGLHSDRERVLSPSPKSEKLWQLFQQIQAGLMRYPRNRKTSGSEPELDQDAGTHHPKAAPAKSKSLDTSPLHSPFDDIRKPMMNTV